MNDFMLNDDDMMRKTGVTQAPRLSPDSSQRKGIAFGRDLESTKPYVRDEDLVFAGRR